MGSDIPEECKENHVSASLPPVTSSSFFCLTPGVALDQLSVLLLLSFPAAGLTLAGVSVSESSVFFWPIRGVGDLRSLEDLECSSLWLSLWARSLVGVWKALGRDSSSIVFPRKRDGDRVRARLRRETPWRCLSFRFFTVSTER